MRFGIRGSLPEAPKPAIVEPKGHFCEQFVEGHLVLFSPRSSDFFVSIQKELRNEK
jgi:hypothetical protein